MLLIHLWYPSACASIELARRTASTPLTTKGLPSQPQRLLCLPSLPLGRLTAAQSSSSKTTRVARWRGSSSDEWLEQSWLCPVGDGAGVPCAAVAHSHRCAAALESKGIERKKKKRIKNGQFMRGHKGWGGSVNWLPQKHATAAKKGWQSNMDLTGTT
jgi:hypothetical protein